MLPSVSSSSLFSLLAGLLLLLLNASVTSSQSVVQYCDTSANFTAGSTYQSNLRLLLSTLATNGSLSGFLKISEGQVPNQVYGLILCRGDLNATECRSCLDSATQEIQQVCLYNKGAMISYEQCVLRFSNQQFLSSIDETRQISTYNRDDAPQLERFNKLLHLLLNSTADWTVNSAKKFATGEVSNFTSEFPTIYSLMQCVPDMSRSDCRQCLWELFNPLPEQFVGKQGGRVLGMRCEMRFELYPFFRLPPTLKLTVPAEHAAEPGQPFLGAGRKNRTGTVLAIVIPAMALISITAICYMVKRKPIIKYPYEIDPDHILNVETLQFDLSTLRVATANFSEGNKLGEGGFGAVYKGLLPNGREIAVKRLLNSGQGLREMKNELVLLAKLQHGNLVKLVGVCLGEEKMVVYEYVPNRSLDTFLFDPARGEQLGWETRYNIINGIARGLLYLHEESQLKIIHRDLKASNILLDAAMKPKISDFGLAKLFDGGQTQGNTNRVVGTFGYMAPEYVMHGKFSIKSDVFSFGILVLEILTGRRNTGSYNSEVAQDLLSYTWEKWNEGTALEIVDPALGAQYKGSDILRCIQIGLLCVQESPSDRPTMSTIVVLLNAETVSLQAPSRPAFYVGRSSSSSILVANNPRSQNGRHDRESKPLPTSPNEVSISVLEPR